MTPHTPVSAEVTTVLGALIDRLGRQGATLVEGWPPGIDPVGQAETFGFHVGLFFAHQDPTGQIPDPGNWYRKSGRA